MSFIHSFISYFWDGLWGQQPTWVCHGSLQYMEQEVVFSELCTAAEGISHDEHSTPNNKSSVQWHSLTLTHTHARTHHDTMKYCPILSLSLSLSLSKWVSRSGCLLSLSVYPRFQRWKKVLTCFTCKKVLIMPKRSFHNSISASSRHIVSL